MDNINFKFKINFFFVLVQFFVFYSCSKKERQEQKLEDLSGEFESIGQISQGCVSDLAILGDYLFVVENCEESLFHVYSSKTFEKLTEFGRLGAGPNEFTYPRSTNQYLYEIDSLYMWIQDVSYLYKINLTKSIINNEVSIVKKLEHTFNLVREINMLSDSSLIGNSNEIDAPYFVYYPDNGSAYYSPPLFEVSNSANLPLSKKSILFNNIIRVKPDRSRFVLAMDLFKRIDIFDSKLNHLYVIDYNMPYQDISNTDRRMNDHTIRYYVDLDLSDRYIYALNWQMTFRYYLDQHNVATSLEVYNWGGELVKTYNFGERIVAIAVDENNNQVIGLNDTVEKDQFRTFKMSHLK